MRCVLLLLLCVGCSQTPQEAATQSVVRVGNGLGFAGGVAIAEGHVLTTHDILSEAWTGRLVSGGGQVVTGKVVGRDAEHEVALLRTDGDGILAADIGSSGDLLKSDALVTLVFDDDGNASVRQGRVVRWQYSGGIGYIEADLDVGRNSAGAGVFGPNGRLVGIYAFKVEDRAFVLPIEYVTNGPDALTASLLGERSDDSAFGPTRKSAAEHQEKIRTKLYYDALVSEYSYSGKSLIVSMTMLDKKASPSRVKSIDYVLEAADSAHERRQVAAGSFSRADQAWIEKSAAFKKIREAMADAYGELWVQDMLDPCDYGDLRVRMATGDICSKTRLGDIHAVSVTLSDGRTTGPLTIFNMADVCGGSGADQGNGWDAAWKGMGADSSTESGAKAGVGNKGKKGKKEKNGKKGRRKRRR
ncbi:MAG: hypothetical protein A2341_21800 [Deltaproteobacteria bacterium RIFOXYB12_FULL_58_9]|nr:MAG: hypothetical protein A2341_21800 [Deltaproteobacteria bacterium RIFOXYB12_FULL_58_9]